MKQADLQRRAFLRGNPPSRNLTTIRPPWAIEASIFTEKCTRCDECIKACPEKIIIRGDGGYPEINFQQGECTFCMQCVDSCNADAFIKLPTDKEIDLIIKTIKPWNLNVSFNNTCLSMNAVVCRACADNCDEQSIQFQLKVGGISEPQFTQDSCTGCGACLSVCPVHAIQITSVIDQNQS